MGRILCSISPTKCARRTGCEERPCAAQAGQGTAAAASSVLGGERRRHFASAWWPYVTLTVALIMLLIERDQSKRVVLKKWAKWTALYLVVWVTGIVLVALLMSLNHAY